MNQSIYTVQRTMLLQSLWS